MRAALLLFVLVAGSGCSCVTHLTVLGLVVGAGVAARDPSTTAVVVDLARETCDVCRP